MSEQQRSVLGAIVIVACLALIGFLVYAKVDGAVTLAVSTVTLLVAYFTSPPPRPNPPSAFVLVAGLALIASSVFFLACKAVSSAGDAVCESLVAYNDTPLEEAICATFDDFVAIGNLVLGTRAAKHASADAGAEPKTSTCQMVPHTDVCATNEELRAAIKSRKVGAK